MGPHEFHHIFLLEGQQLQRNAPVPLAGAPPFSHGQTELLGLEYETENCSGFWPPLMFSMLAVNVLTVDC